MADLEGFLYGDLDRQPVSGGQPPKLTGTGSDPTHHIVLEDINGNQIGFVATDQQGDMDERTVRIYPRAEPATPYVTEKQEAFSGFGQVRWEDNRSKYWWGSGVDTTKGKIALAPLPRYADSPWRDYAMYQPNDDDTSFVWEGLYGDNLYMAMKFTASATWSGSASALYLWAKRVGTPAALRVRLIQDSAGTPTGTTHITTNVNANSYNKDVGDWIKVSLTGYTPQSGVTYWVVVDGQGGTRADKCWMIGRSGTRTVALSSSNGSTWGTPNPSGDFFYRIVGPYSGFIPRFFDYKGQLYFVSSYSEWSNSRLFMNGYRGACDSNAGALTKLKDSTQTAWATEITGNEVARIVAGNPSGEETDWRAVSSGISGELTMANSWYITHGTSDEYVVVGSENWDEISITTPTNMRKVYGVGVADGIVYFARGNLRNVSAMRSYNSSGTWTTQFKETSVQAAHIQVLNDPISGPVIWFGENPNEMGTYQPYVCQSEPTSWDNSTLNYVSLLAHAGVPGQNVPWTTADGNVTVGTTARSEVEIYVYIGKLYVGGLSINNGGTGYTNGTQTLNVVEVGSSQTGQISVTVTAGVVTSINSVITAGHSYTVGSTLNTTGGGGSGCTIDVNGVQGFSTGKLAYANFVDAESTSYTVDLKNMNLLSLQMSYNSLSDTAQKLSDGDLTFDLDDSADGASPYVNLSITGMALDGQRQEDNYISMDLTQYANAASTASVSLTLANAKTRSFKIVLKGKSYALRDIKPIPVGDQNNDNITGLEVYGDPENLWVFTETGLGSIQNNYYLPLPQRELKVARHPLNGTGHEVSDVYLLFTWHGRLQRYFRQNLEDLGPDFPLELGSHDGNIVSVKAYPGRVYVAYDNGPSSASKILCFKGGEWHEVFTGHNGERIRGLHIQAIPGHPDRLWFNCGADILWVPIILDSTELPENTTYRFVPTGRLTTSWVYTSEAHLNKLFRSVLVAMQRANDSDLSVVLQYQIDDEDNAWVTCDRNELVSASAREYFIGDFSHGAAKAGNRIRMRIILETNVISKTPIVHSIQHKIYRMPEVKFTYTWLSKVSNLSINLRGDEEKVVGSQGSVDEAMALLDTWAQVNMPLQVRTNIARLKDKLVVMEPSPSQLLLLVNDEGIQEQMIQVAVNDA